MHERPEKPRATIEQRLKAYHKIMDWKEEQRRIRNNDNQQPPQLNEIS